MFALSIAREGIECGRRIGTAEWTIVADIGPQSSLNRPPLGQQRHWRVIAMDAVRRHHVGADEVGERCQDGGGGTDMIGQGRQRQVNAFACIGLALAIERLMQCELRMEDHRQQARTGVAPGNDMEWRWRLADLLTGPAGELLPNVLDHLPLARHDLQRLGDILAELGEAGRSAAQA